MQKYKGWALEKERCTPHLARPHTPCAHPPHPASFHTPLGPMPRTYVKGLVKQRAGDKAGMACEAPGCTNIESSSCHRGCALPLRWGVLVSLRLRCGVCEQEKIGVCKPILGVWALALGVWEPGVCVEVGCGRRARCFARITEYSSASSLTIFVNMPEVSFCDHNVSSDNPPHVRKGERQREDERALAEWNDSHSAEL